MSMGRVPKGYLRIQSCEPSIGTRKWKVISQGALSVVQDEHVSKIRAVAKGQFCLISQKDILRDTDLTTEPTISCWSSWWTFAWKWQCNLPNNSS